MTQVKSNDTGTAQSPRYDSPCFDPRGAFAWTLRSSEIARREQQKRPLGPSGPASITPDGTGRREKDTSRGRRSETPTFDPRGAFAWTLRSGGIARLGREQRLPATKQPGVLAVAA